MIDVVSTAVSHGLGTQVVSVEAHMSSGIPQIIVIGLADQTIREAKERLVVALLEQGIKLGNRKYIVSLNPTDVKKQGSHLDLPIAIALLKASNVLPKSDLKIGAVGGLNLSGQLTASNELFSLISELREVGCDCIIIPKSALPIKKFFKETCLVGLEHLSEVIELLSQKDEAIQEIYRNWNIELSIAEYDHEDGHEGGNESYIEIQSELDFSHVIGQELAKRGIMIALAGHHHMLMYGPPGTGKSMLGNYIPSIQPFLEEKALYEHYMIHSRGGFPIDYEKKVREPFRMPHTGISASAMLGGMHVTMLGEVTLAHRGVLYLDEMPEFKRDVIEGLRGPLEAGRLHLSKTQYKGEVPADFTLVATANPCPCGYHGFSDRCNCSERDISRYFSKLSGPILDRFDLKIEVAFKEELKDEKANKDHEIIIGESAEVRTDALGSKEMALQILKAREVQKSRYGDETLFNGTLDSKGIAKWCTMDEKALAWLNSNVKVRSGEDSMRFYNKIVKVGRTIADLEGSKVIERKHLIEAFYYNRRKIV